MDAIRKLLCRLGFHNHRYGAVPGHTGLHMRCSRCLDTSHACPFGLGHSQIG